MDASAFMHGAHHMPDHGYTHPHYMHNARPATSGGVHDPEKHAYYPANPPISCDIKPRLTKEQHDMLEGEFQKQSKPNTQAKKGFAEHLGVPLDKVNNWFQNRRAKAKQDVKKQAGVMNLFAAQQQQQQQIQQQQQQLQPVSTHVGFDVHVSTSPAFNAADYDFMMNHCTSDSYLDAQPGDVFTTNGNFDTGAQAGSSNAEFPQYALHHQASAPELFDVQGDLNRRTLTQEAFDAMPVPGMEGLGSYHAYSNDFGQLLPHGLPVTNNGEFKEQAVFYNFSNEVPPPMSSRDSSAPSSIADSNFASTLSLPDQQEASAPASEWADSRSSSLASHPTVDGQAPATTAPWQTGMSVPVDFDQKFQQAAQVQVSEQPQQMPQGSGMWNPGPLAGDLLQDQTLSQTLDESISPTQRDMRFKSPAPPSNIAARRQRPRPAALGLASLRSQSYSGAAQPISPSQSAPPMTAPGHQLRRIRSSNVVNGGVPGRVQKTSVPSSAQRSPMGWTFADSLNSPKALRHASSMSQASGSLAPPTPRSPHEFGMADQPTRPVIPQWPSSSSQASRQPSIAESDLESHGNFRPPGSATAPNFGSPPFGSPPHTPMYHQTQFLQQRMNVAAISENTPPQSAPASQTHFGTNMFFSQMSQPQMHAIHQQSLQEQQQQQQQQHMQHSGFNYDLGFTPDAPAAQPAADFPVPYASRVPVVDAATGNLVMDYPPHMQPTASGPNDNPEQQPPVASPAGQFSQFSATVSPRSAHGKPAQPAELEFHAYSPSDEMKRSSTVRKTVDNEPKNYSFANQTAANFESGKKPATGKMSSSPESLS